MADLDEIALKIQSFIKNGKDEKEISKELQISIHTVRSYIKYLKKI
jgi:hypothetical protein